jgi:hypothetical protein
MQRETKVARYKLEIRFSFLNLIHVILKDNGSGAVRPTKPDKHFERVFKFKVNGIQNTSNHFS